MQAKGQRFGRLVKSYNAFGELRRQKKAPHTEVFYFPIKPSEPGKFLEQEYRSLNNATDEQITDFIRDVGKHLSDGAFGDPTHAEEILDMCYAELARRLNAHQK